MRLSDRFLFKKSVQCLSVKPQVYCTFFFFLCELDSVTLNHTFHVQSSEQVLLCGLLNVVNNNSHLFSVHELILSSLQQ